MPNPDVTVHINMTEIAPDIAVSFVAVNQIINAMREYDPDLGCIVADLLRRAARSSKEGYISDQLDALASVADYEILRPEGTTPAGH